MQIFSKKYYYSDSNLYIKYDYGPNLKYLKSRRGYCRGNCTWYAYSRASELLGKTFNTAFSRDAGRWYSINKNGGYYNYGSTPKVGSLVVFNYGNGGDAHIAVVEDIINGVPYVSESGYALSTTKPTAATIVFKYQSVYNWAGGRSLKGYIYLR